MHHFFYISRNHVPLSTNKLTHNKDKNSFVYNLLGIYREDGTWDVFSAVVVIEDTRSCLQHFFREFVSCCSKSCFILAVSSSSSTLDLFILYSSIYLFIGSVVFKVESTAKREMSLIPYDSMTILVMAFTHFM